MTAKEYLNQTFRLDQRINSKLERVEVLRALAQKVTASYENEPVSHSRCVTSLENTIHRLMEAEDELSQAIDMLLEMGTIIQKVQNLEYQLLLELRYLCFKSWSEIAVRMNLEERYVYKVHGRALQEVEKILASERRHEKTVLDIPRM